MKTVRLGVIALGIGFAAHPALALESYVLYDNFSTSPLDGNRWATVERVRTVEGSAMRLVQRDGGLTTSDAGTQAVSWGDNVTRPGPVTQLRTNLRINAVDATGCAPNPAPTQARARVLATFFNTGNRVAGSLLGDVLAQINVQRFSDSTDAPGVLRVEANVFLCDSSDCNTGGTSLGGASLGTLDVGVNTLLQIEWDRANKQFLFSRDGATAVAAPYTVDDSTSPGNDIKAVGTRTVVASCASAPRAFGSVDARFDNVSVNASARP